MGQETSEQLKWSLRVLAGLSAVIGIGFIAWSLIIQNPPKSALPVGLIVLGVVGVIVGVVGFFHSLCGRCCLSIFLLVTGLLIIGEFGIIISLFANLDGNVENLVNYNIDQEKNDKKDKKDKEKEDKSPSPSPPSTDFVPSPMDMGTGTYNDYSPPTDSMSTMPMTGKRLRNLLQGNDDLSADELAMQNTIEDELSIGRYVFLVFIILQFIALLVTIVMRVRSPYKDDPDTIEEHRAARSAMAQIQMESLKSSVRSKQATSPAPDGGNFYTASGKMMKSVTRKMTQKYGEFTQDPAYQRKWWQKMFG